MIRHVHHHTHGHTFTLLGCKEAKKTTSFARPCITNSILRSTAAIAKDASAEVMRVKKREKKSKTNTKHLLIMMIGQMQC